MAGDVVATVAPAGPAAAERIAAGLTELRSWGLEVREPRRGRHRAALLAGRLRRGPRRRPADCLAGPRVAAVWCVRGGYGAQRVVDLLDWAALAQATPKLLVGFSDVTALHQAFAARLGVATVLGPVLTSIAEADTSHPGRDPGAAAGGPDHRGHRHHRGRRGRPTARWSAAT